MKEKIKNIIYNLNYYFLMKNAVLFESNPDFCDNTRAVFERMVKLNLNKKYKLVWFVSDDKLFSDVKIKNVLFIGENKRIKRLFYNFFAKYIIDCNRFIRKRNKHQLRIHLTHGTPLKLASVYCGMAGEIDWLIQISDYFTKYNEELFNIDKSRIITTGFPRNDILLDKKNNYSFSPNIKRNKTICWFPTYRNHKDHLSGKKMFPFGIPTIDNKSKLEQLNEVLKKESVLLVIKFHPAEDTSFIKKCNLSNIKLINDESFSQKHLTLYHYLGNIDAMITDYSSVYYDFLLTDKPIGIAVPDINEYKKNNTIIYDNYEDYIVGEYIYNFDDLIKFVRNVSKNKDISYKDRVAKKKIYQKYCDENASNRVIDILLKNGGGKK